MLFVDSREPQDIQELLSTDARVVTLPTGDILDPESGLLVERKTARDFIASIADGRLDDQCARMAECGSLRFEFAGVPIRVPVKIPVLLIHGTLWPEGKDTLKVKADGQSTDWNYWAVTMKLVSIQDSGIIVLIVPQQYFSECVGYLRSWAKKPKHRQVKKPRGIWSKPEPEIELMSLLAGGRRRAEILLNEYGSVGAALIELDNWPKLDGIGPGTVKRVKILLGDVPVFIPF